MLRKQVTLNDHCCRRTRGLSQLTAACPELVPIHRLPNLTALRGNRQLARELHAWYTGQTGTVHGRNRLSGVAIAILSTENHSEASSNSGANPADMGIDQTS
jgi:hypothetical protein